MSESNFVLAIDTALFGCGVCLYDRVSDRYYSDVKPMPRGQAEHLVPMVEQVMLDGQFEYSDLNAIITTIGPGAFTGLRIGLSTARAFSLALDIPVYGVTTLEVVAYDYSLKNTSKQPFTVIVETKRKDFYTQNFDCNGGAEGAAEALEFQDLQNVAHEVLIGDAALRFIELSSEASKYKYLKGYEMINTQNVVRGFFDRPQLYAKNPEPVYLRGPDVSQPKKKQRVLEDG